MISVRLFKEKSMEVATKEDFVMGYKHETGLFDHNGSRPTHLGNVKVIGPHKKGFLKTIAEGAHELEETSKKQFAETLLKQRIGRRTDLDPSEDFRG